MRTVGLSCGLALALALGVATAEPYSPKKIASDTEWLLHVDFEAMTKSDLGKAVAAKIAEKGDDVGCDELQKRFKFDAKKDLRSATLYGNSDKNEEGVMILRGKFEPEEFIGMVSGLDDYATQAYEDYVVHSWTDAKEGDGVPGFGTFIGQKVLVLAKSRAAVTHALDTLDGVDKGLAGTEMGDRLADMPKKSFMVGAANMKNLDAAKANAQMIRNAESAAFSLAEVKGDMQFQLGLEAPNEQVAAQMRAMMMGMLAFASLNEQQAPELALLALASDVTVKGSVVNILLRYPVGDIIDMIEKDSFTALGGHHKAK